MWKEELPDCFYQLCDHFIGEIAKSLYVYTEYLWHNIIIAYIPAL